MDIETSLVGALGVEALASMTQSLNPAYTVSTFSSGTFAIEEREPSISDTAIDGAVARFLVSFSEEPSTVADGNGRVRVAVYVPKGERLACFSSDISAQTTQRLALLGLGIEVNFYPHSDGDAS